MKFTIISITLLASFANSFSQKQNSFGKAIGGLESKSVKYNNLERTYDIYVPKNVSTPSPLVFMFHGGGGNSNEAAHSTQWLAKAVKEGFILVLPNGTRPNMDQPAQFGKNGQNWNDGASRELSATKNNINDVGFIRMLADTICKNYRVDKKRIFATGFSNGASMSFRLGIECPDIFAAIAPVSGTLWVDNATLKKSLSVLYISGDNDPLNPYNGGQIKVGKRDLGFKKPQEKIIAQWVSMLNVKLDTSYSNNKMRIIKYSNSKSELKWILVKDLGHHWPGGKVTLPKWLAGSPSNELNATEVIWDFFKVHNTANE